MNQPSADASAVSLTGQKLEGEALTAPKTQVAGGWSRQRWLMLVLLVFAAQVALIFALGEKRFPLPRAAANVPQLTLADNANELVALNDPTLFALPHAGDFVSANWGQTPIVPPLSFRWAEPSLPSLLASEKLGAIFVQFMQTNQLVAPPLDFKPEPALSELVLPLPPVFAQNSTLRVEGGLVQRRLLTRVDLPSLSYPDVIAPSRVQALVNEAGIVFSAVLLPPDNAMEITGRPDVGDTKALQIARSLRFAPAPRPTVGQLVFNWRTIAPPLTNSSASQP